MSRVKRGTTKNKRKSKILKQAKGFRNARSTKFKQAKQALIRAGQHAFGHRRKKKRVFRKLWQIQISAGLKEHNISYSRFIEKITKGKFGIDRKMLALLAREDITAFDRAVSEITGEKIERKEIPKITEIEKKIEKKTEELNKKDTDTKKSKSSKTDDLTKIEGIGPKTAEYFAKNKIETFADLAEKKVGELRDLLDNESTLSKYDPKTWSKQAKLARDERWDELKTLQDELIGGEKK